MILYMHTSIILLKICNDIVNNMKKKVSVMWALVTGASSGIGRDMSRYLYKLGYNLIIVARNEEKLNELKAELSQNKSNDNLKKVQDEEQIKNVTERKKENEIENNSANPQEQQIIIKQVDLSDRNQCIKLYGETKNISLDLLVNNAGFGVFGEFVETDLEKDINLINTNITAVHILTKLYLKDMIKNNKGHILNVASIAGMEPGPLMAAYYASKSYVIRLSRAINKEIKKKKANVNISILCPGPVDTNFNNVAKVVFKAPSMSSEEVAKYGIDKALKGKLIIIPGFLNKCVRFFSKIIPDCILEEVAYHIQRRKKN